MMIETRHTNLPLSEPLRAFVEKRVAATLRRHLDRVARVVVRVSDVNGPRGGAADKVCKIQAELEGAPSVVAQGAADDAYDAVRSAALRLGQSVDRQLARQRR